ncbi:hypothetical protein [Candidatus Neptunichlamydia sp. REUL1]|uniref:hypothetical protein n=1 Tax=Candidatus Neptunichlamydia sp. REUL1 TaxID=3064277 RepID=UPI002931049A|nr:hypothetical protein [Candidatus Neptunochlamydia sp. REUL1]
MSELVTHKLGSSNIGPNLEKPIANSENGASGYFNIPIVWLGFEPTTNPHAIRVA